MKSLMIAALLVGTAGLASCDRGAKAPAERGVCWHAIPEKGGGVKFNALARNVDSIEKCAGELESMRLRFLGMGGGAREIMGAYQGSYLFLLDEGIFRGETLRGARYVLLVRAGDGQLAIPGAMPQQP